MSLDQVEPTASNQPLTKPSILIVDDSRVVRVSLKNILQKDYEIIEAEDGDDAWNILLQKPEIRLVFSDLSMPKMDGHELLKKIRHSDTENLNRLPFIVITGREEDQKTRNRLINEGANDLITKPFNTEDIINHTARHVEQHLTSNRDTQNQEEFLSGISDKVTFSKHARKALSFAIRNKNELALLLLKIDQFATIKTHYSDPAIEHILITTAEIIRSHTRIDDKTAYFGEGSFAILLPAANAVGTKYLGQRILSDIQAKKFYLGESDDCVTASISVSAPDIKPGTTFSEILGLAEQRLEAAINAGGNRLVDKGNATITPVSTLISDNSELQSENSELFKQTELSMRKLAAQEVQRIKAEQAPGNGSSANNDDINELNDALLLAEQENKLLKEELHRLQLQNEELEPYKKRFHEADSLQQQTNLKLQQLKSDYEEMCIRAENAETTQSRLVESDNDHSIIEEHLLQESQQLQNQLNSANERIEKSLHAYKRAESNVSNLKEQLIRQKEKYEIELADANMMHSIAEEKLSKLQKRVVAAEKKSQPFTFTETPTIAPIEKASGSRINTITLRQPMAHTTAPNSSKKNPQKKPSTTSIKNTGRAKRSWAFKLLIVAICGLLAVVTYQIWFDKQLTLGTGIVDHDTQSHPAAKPGFNNDSPNGSNMKHEQIDKVDAVDKAPLHRSDQKVNTKLQTEMMLRQKAEKEFLKLSQKSNRS